MNDVAIFIDLDNVVIGAKQAGLNFDIDLVLDYISNLKKGRVVLRRAYGDGRQNQKLLRQLTTAGFIIQATVVLNSYGKNLADMQIVVDTMDTLVDGQHFNTYVLITGDRDFTPLVQSLRKRGKQVIGVGIQHTVSQSLINLCDQYVFYKSITADSRLTETEVQDLLMQTLLELCGTKNTPVQASVLKQRMIEKSGGLFNHVDHVDGNFRDFLLQFAELIYVNQQDTTIYASLLQEKPEPSDLLHLSYRTGLKKQRLRVVPSDVRLIILRDMINMLKKSKEVIWRQLLDTLAERYESEGQDISKNAINAMLLVARKALVIRTLKGTSLSTAPVLLELAGDKPLKKAVLLCDAAYLQGIRALSEPFEIREATLALYDSEKYLKYLEFVLNNYCSDGDSE
jgi:uncharacterized LabA/DUF88 family protein